MTDTAALGHPVFDADNHYYEAVDAFTRHLDPALGPRVIQWCEINDRKYHVIGGRVSRAVTNPTFDPIAMPGAGPPTANPRPASPRSTSRTSPGACSSPPSG